MKKGEVTAFLSLIFILLMSLIASVIASASTQTLKNRKRGDMDRALKSVFAEYQKDMLEDFDIFALDATYETGEFREEEIENRLVLYGMNRTDFTIEKIQFLTDDHGRPYREQIIAYMKHKMGVAQMEELSGMTGEWKSQADKEEQHVQEEENVELDLEESLQLEEQSLPAENNPMDVISSIKKRGIVDVVMKGKEISEKTVTAGEMLDHRTLNQGKGNFKVKEDTVDFTSNLYFTSYLLEKFCAADQSEKTGKLEYELEYIVNGAQSDRENLEAVLKKILGIRTVANYGYLQTDSEKKAEAEAMAAALSGAIALPMLQGLIKQAILLAWAFGEGIMDLRTLISGGKIPIKKSREDWQLSLAGLLKLGTEEDTGVGKESQHGLSYKEYIRMLLTFEKQDQSTMRSLAVLELRMKEKLESFRADYCVSKIKIKSKCNINEKVYYEFATEFGYQ